MFLYQRYFEYNIGDITNTVETEDKDTIIYIPERSIKTDFNVDLK